MLSYSARKALELAIPSIIAFASTATAVADPNVMSPASPEPISSLQLSNQLIQQRDAYQRDLVALETLYGPYDQRLLESLTDLAYTEIELGDFPTAGELLDRRLQVVRVQEGLDSLNQIPLLEDGIKNDIRLGDWTSASNRFETIHSLIENNSEELTIELLTQAKELKDWYLHAILLDTPDMREKQGRRIGELQFRLMDDASSLFADDPNALVPWLYQDAVDEYRSVSVRRIRRFLGKAPAIFIREKIFRTNEQSIASTFVSMKKIRDIFADQNNLEGEAMAMIYLADFRLATSKGSAIALYRGAMDKLVEAGIPEEKIEEFFKRPSAIPTAEFHPTLDDALQAQAARGVMIRDNHDAASSSLSSYDLGRYYAWHPFMPGIERPPLPDSISSFELDYETAVLNFSLNSRGQPRNIEVQDSSSDSVKTTSAAIRGIQGIRFRPQFIDKRWQSVDDVAITYHYPSPATADDEYN